MVGKHSKCLILFHYVVLTQNGRNYLMSTKDLFKLRLFLSEFLHCVKFLAFEVDAPSKQTLLFLFWDICM